MIKAKIKGWHCQLIAVGVLCFIIIPPIWRAYAKRISSEQINREELIGCWMQDSNSDDVTASSKRRTFALFDADGKYYIGIGCSISSCSEAYTGNWYYSDKKNYLLKIIPCGFHAWIRLNFDHDAGPQFYLRKENGEIRMYRGDYRAAISDGEFRRAKELNLEELKQLVNKGSLD